MPPPRFETLNARDFCFSSLLFKIQARIVGRARGGALFRRHAATVPLKDDAKESGLLAKYMRALDRKPITTKVCFASFFSFYFSG